MKQEANQLLHTIWEISGSHTQNNTVLFTNSNLLTLFTLALLCAFTRCSHAHLGIFYRLQHGACDCFKFWTTRIFQKLKNFEAATPPPRSIPGSGIYHHATVTDVNPSRFPVADLGGREAGRANGPDPGSR